MDVITMMYRLAEAAWYIKALCAGVAWLVMMGVMELWPVRKRRRGESYLMSRLRDVEERRAAAERQEKVRWVHEKSPSSEHYRWLQQEYAKKAFEEARQSAPRDYARLANLAGRVADLKEGRNVSVPERVEREHSRTSVLLVQERRRASEREGAIEVTNHPLFRRR